MKTIILPPVVILLAALSAGGADGTELPGDAVLRAYLSAESEKLESSFLPGVVTAADFESMRSRLREEYFYMLGLWPLPEKTPLHPKVTGVLDRGEYLVEKLCFQSREHLYVTGNLYRPRKDVAGRLPAILYVCGHSPAGRNGNKTQFQDHGIWFARHGYVCLVIDTLQLGEIAAIHHGTYREQRWWWHSAGYTSAGVECWNGVRAIDYLVSRPDVDPERIGVTGISGGGAASFWIAAADERVRAAAPVSGMADLTSYVGHEIVNGHCDCMFLYNTFRWNWTTIGALICPRPLLFMNSDRDPIFPMDANERVIARLEHLYGRFGAGERVDAVVSIGGHEYRRDLRQASFRFMNVWLKHEANLVGDSEPERTVADAQGPSIPREELRVFPADSDIPADQWNTRIDEVFVPRASVPLPAPGEHAAWRSKLIRELSRVCFGAWSPADLRTDGAPAAGPDAVVPAPKGSFKIVGPSGSSGEPAWIVVLGPADSDSALPDWASEVVKGEAACLLSPFGIGPTTWTRKNPPNTAERSFVLLGETADSLRVLDIVRLARLHGSRKLKLLGRGVGGVLAAYAAVYASNIEQIVAIAPPPSHAPSAAGAPYGPAILNVLRVLDIPDAFGLLAPRRVTLIGADREAFRRTGEIFERAGAKGSFELR